MIKKLSSLGILTATYFGITLPAWAADVNPCPAAGTGGGFQKLCNLKTDNLGVFIQNVITFLFIIAVIAATFFLIYGGIRWISSGGDKAAVEGARSIIIAAVVGLVVTFLTYLILNFVMQLFGLSNVGSFTIPTLAL